MIFLVRYILNKINEYRQYKHSSQLAKSCVWGDGFCESKLYSSKLTQLLNIKITNKTNLRDSIIFGNYCNVSCNITLNHKGTIVIGDYVFMNFVKMRIDQHLRIGSHCLFGPNVVIWDTDNHPISASERYRQAEELASEFPLHKSYESNSASIVIEENVWVGMDVLILGGVRIGKGAIVAARSVVTKDVEPYTMVGGVPAKKIGVVPL